MNAIRGRHCARAKSVLSSKDAFQDLFGHEIDFQQRIAEKLAETKEEVSKMTSTEEADVDMATK
jgi:hypothetical protein